MAACSGGVEWTTIIKPILAANYGSFNKQEIPNFVKGIIKSEIELLNNPEYDLFYTAFSVLAADSISSCADSFEKNQIKNVCHATRILLQYLVNRLSRILSPGVTLYSPQLIRVILLAIHGLCEGHSTLVYADKHALTSDMKIAKLPTNTKSATPGETTSQPSEALKRPRSDLTARVMEQLMTPLSPHPPILVPVTTPAAEINNEQANQTRNEQSTDKKISDNELQMKNQFITKNIKSLKALKAGDKIIDMCINLVYLSPYLNKCKEDNAKHGTCSSQNEALMIKQNLSNLLSDVSFVAGALSLPVLEPLTEQGIMNLTLLSRACLSVALTVSTAVIVLSSNQTTAKTNTSSTNQARNEDEVDQYCIGLVEKCIEVFTQVSNTIAHSKHAEKCVAQNHQMLATSMLLQGLWYQLSSHTDKGKDEKGKSPSRTRESSSRINLQKIQQGFSILSVALASQALQLSGALMSDLDDEDTCNEPEIPMKVDIFSKYSSSQRVSYILASAPIHQLLHYLAIISYRKAYTLKRIMKPATEEDTISFSDSTIYNGDDFSFSDDSSGEEDDDSEPILGLWLEKTLAPKVVPEGSEIDSEREEKPQPSNQQQSQPSQQTHQVSGGIIPEKGEPHGYITLATDIFEFLSTYFLSSNCSIVKTSIISNIGEQHMVILAAIIRDLDREMSKTKTGTIPSYFGIALGSLYYKFSHFLTLYTHNLLATSVLSDTLQISLLSHLGVNPTPSDAPWPLMVYPRTLVALSQIIVLKKQPEQEALILRIWSRAINMLTENIVNPPTTFEVENEDLNVEHAQLLLFFFHSLSLLQKKSVLLSVSKALIRCGETIKSGGQLRECQLLHIARLLHIFEHLMRHLYDIPSVLAEQVKWNLFSATSLLANENGPKGAKIPSRMYCPSKDVPDNLNRPSSQEDLGMKPKFYNLTSVEMIHEETPKLDGLACNFILATPEKLKYPALIDALIDILSVINQCDSNWLRKDRSPNLSMLCAIQYCFMAAWRMLLLLPPSSAFISQLGMNSETKDTPQLLYSLIWGPRTGCNVYSGYIKDNLMKQATFTSNAETLLKTISSTMTSLHYTATLARNVLANFKAKCVTNPDNIQLCDLIILDVIVAKLLVHLHDQKSAQNTTVLETAISILPDVLNVFNHVSRCTRSGLVSFMEEGNTETSVENQGSLLEILAITSNQPSQTKVLTSTLRGLLPATIRSYLERWNGPKASYTPSYVYSNDQIPSESNILSVLKIHISKLYRSEIFINNESLKHLLHALIAFTGEILAKLPEEDNALRQNIITALLPTSLDACSEYLHDVLLHSILDPQNEDQQREVYCEVLRHCYRVVINECKPPLVTDKVLQECLKIMETLLDSNIGCSALHNFFTSKTEQKVSLIKILMSTQNMKTIKNYSSYVHKFFNAIFAAAEKTPGGILEQMLATTLSGLANVDKNELCEWLHYLLLGQFKLDSPEVEPEDDMMDITCCQEENPPAFENAALAENQKLLKYLTFYIVKDNQVGEVVATSIIEALIPIGSRLLGLDLAGTGFSDVMQIMVALANSGSRKGHTHLFFAATLWLEQWKDYILETRMLQQIKEEGTLQGRCKDVVEAVGQLLSYVADIVAALGPAHNLSNAQGSSERAQSPMTNWDVSGELSPDKLDCEWLEELAAEEEEDSLGDDSDEDTLCSKLCTFTMTQKDFVQQHWYHCHTCKMVDGVGVCSICARVCHKSHDVTYSKYGNFFCDCGAKDDGSCQALVKRSPLSSDEVPMPVASTSVEHAKIRRTANSPAPDSKLDKIKDEKSKQRIALAKQLESCSEALMHHAEASPIISSLLELSCLLLNAVKASCEKNSSVGCHHRAQNALQKLHETPKHFETTDQLMMPTLGSQEGAFENVRSNYPGDQGQTIRQLLSAHMIRRVAMCCLSSPQGKRQHLAVSHEKGKITVLQLSALLMQADSSKRKLTLTRLASAPIPFTVLSITGNPCNEDFLAVCGLKDCHVLTFSTEGTVVQHLVLHPQLETGNYIIRAIWLPGSQTQLALVTADFIKIYDLSKDALSPQYYFLVPSGKIRDATFVFPEDGEPCLLVMSSAGYIYSQAMCEESSAEHGLFYVTNTLEVSHPEIKDVSGLVAGGGVSIYYSHTLQLLFFSFSQGKSFIAPLKSLKSYELNTVFQIQLSKTSSNANGSKSSSQSQQLQPLCEWSEVPNHPGLVCSVLQSSNNPVILMIKPDTILVQEIKVVPAKAKILDMVAIRHASSSSELRTTLILLCEDGSLRIYMAGQEQTGYWLSPAIQASNPLIASLKMGKKKKINKSNKQMGASSAPNFPVDFFEHSQVLNDIEYGGNDVLEVYNSEQIKNRLSKQGQYIVNTRPAGFTLEISNTDPSAVITGLRILVGSQDPIRSPAFVEILGRSIQLNVTSARWFDYPLTREESLQADRKLSVSFGPSQDPDCVTMVDSILIYSKTKDSFGWPEESEELASSNANGASSSSSTDNENNQSALQQMTPLDRAMAGILEVLDGCFTLFDATDDKQQQQKSVAINIATNLLTLPTPNSIQCYAKSLLATLHPSKVSYHQFKDQAILKYVTEMLSDFDKIQDARDLDSESFYRLVLMTRSIAAGRPYNLTRISETLYVGKEKNLMVHLLENFWRLHAAKPVNIVLAPVCIPGLTHVETTVHAIVEIINAFIFSDRELVQQAAQLYMKLLLCKDTAVSFSAKQALIRVLRPRQRSPQKLPAQHSITPPSTAPPVQQPSQESTEEANQAPVDAVVPFGIEEGAVAASNPMDAPLAVGDGAFPPLLDINPFHPDDVDETMVELAIALSLQEHDSVANLLTVQQNLQQGLQNFSGQALQSLQALATQAQPGPSHEPGHLSDTTASAGGSDDEGSTAATDGSTLRTSPAEQGWESGGSGADEIFERIATSHKSSHGHTPCDNPDTCLDCIQMKETKGWDSHDNGAEEMFERIAASHKCSQGHSSCDNQDNCFDCMQMKEMRLRFTERLLLEKLLAFLPQLKEVGGVQAIPFLQVILILTSDLEGDDQCDRNCLDRLLQALITELDTKDPVDVNAVSECQRSPQLEVHLVMMRFLSVLMSRAKYTNKNATESDHFVSQTTATALLENNAIQYCLGLLKGLLIYWKKQNTNQETSSGSSTLGGALLQCQPMSAAPDMSPFFLKLDVKGLRGDAFESYPQLLTEMAVRLPYQVLKHMENPFSIIIDVFGEEWNYCLCEYMMMNQTPFVRRQVRKLLLFLCGKKDKYHHRRDFHALECHTRGIIKVCQDAGLDTNSTVTISLAYDQLVKLMEHLKSCLEIAINRPNNWQKFCIFSENFVPFLFQASCALDEGVCPTILQLLQNAFGKAQCNKEREKSVESDISEKDNCSILVRHIMEFVSQDVIALFIKTFLLETNSTAVRWQAHDLVQSLHFNSSPDDQEKLKDLLWTFWPQLRSYGRKAAQFIDLLGYFSKKSTDNTDKLQEMVDLAVNSLKAQNQILAEHPNTNLYGKLSQFIELDGYYFETRSCLVCNNPEVPLTSIKLSAIKVDSKFTTTTQIVKLVSSHSISKITLRIGDLKRAKMVRTMNIYYNNRTVQAVVELKNKPAMWNKAKKVTLTSGQTEVKVDFPLPIVACNLMIEYSDFYENIQASSETLQCPRCGVSVPANPGVCGNCGENVFQCHKCRAINYDEKDPFLCHSCGFCKYAKFEYTLTAKACCAVDPIENDEDRKKTLTSISTMQERADRIYKQLSTIRPNVEVILQSIEEGQAQEEGSSSGASNSTHVKQRINLLAQRYCVDCKNSFEELGKISQKVMACRAEIVAYDRKQREDQSVQKRNRFLTIASKDCYGCASSTSEHCLTILNALASIPSPKRVLCMSGLINELVAKNLSRKTTAMQEKVKHLLCLLAKDQTQATEELCDLLMDRIMTALSNHKISSYMSLSVHPEMALLSSLIATEDSCWEQKLKCIIKLYLQACKESKSPSVTEDILMPCLKILISIMIPMNPTSIANKDKTLQELCTICPSEENKINVHRWLQNDAEHSFKNWRQRMPQRSDKPTDIKPSKDECRAKYLTQKYARRWRQSLRGKHSTKLKLSRRHSWLKLILFNKSSRAVRQSACKLIENIFQVQVPQRKQELLDLLTTYLSELGDAGETSTEFLELYRSLMQPDDWKCYLALKGTLVKIADLITKEIEELHQLEDTSLVSDLTDGFALKMLTELLSCFLEHNTIKRVFKGRLVGAVLNGYLALRRLAVQRTRLIDETQEKLFELLEEMTSGTETETKDFMKICIEAVERCAPEDDLTPVFILERLCTIISPEENDIGEFFLTLEKDPQQEDFLQGRMLGNPYSSTEPGLGPLMRDVKNKICQDCELVALLEDDNGMELLVNNKIISLDLPVREVYKKVWLTEGEGEAMRVVYRMRGLLGDATEEFVETLDNKSKQQVNNEEVYKMANVMTECRGLQIVLQRLAGVSNVIRTKPLLQVLLRLLLLCTKVRSNQEQLAHPDLGAIGVLLSTVQRCIAAGKNADPRLTEQILDILETILTIAAAQPLPTFLELANTFGGPEHITALLACASPPPGAAAVSASFLQHLGKVLAALTYGHEERMQLLTSHFAPVLDFERYDLSRTSEDEQKMELFCLLAAGIDRSPAGNTLKAHIHALGIVKKAAEYIAVHAPPTTPLLLLPDNDEWKEFIAKPSLKMILRFLAGLATDHELTQLEIATPECIAVLHRLEQVSSQEHVGSLSENLLEALRTNPAVAARVEQVRQQTRAEKKRLAMAMREKQLGALGMKANEKGQVVARSPLLTQLEELGEETGLTCVICREGYRCQPAKVLGIYTYTKRCPVEEEERKQRRTLGYSTVTHFNVVHVDCHMAAVRQARARDEWESAALQNANTKCNGLLPLWGPSVPESAFASCLARHNTYLQECTGHRDIGYGSTVHDLKLLLLRFAQEKAFNEDAGGGGPESNMHLLGYLIHMALYVLNTTRSAQREDKCLTSFLAAGTETWVANSFMADGPLYWACMSLLLRPTNRWQQGERVAHLRRILVLAQARHTERIPDSQSAKPPTRLSDASPQDYAVYKPFLIFFGLVDGMYRLFFKKVGCGGEEQWPSALADFIRHNDEALLRASDQLLAFYTEELLPCASFDEFCDVLGLLGEVDDPATFLSDVLRSVGTG